MSNSSPSSASAIVAKAASGWHDLKIEGYSLTKGLSIGEFIRSETFVIAGHRWCIRYYPDGAASDDADCIAIYVQRDDNSDESHFKRANKSNAVTDGDRSNRPIRGDDVDHSDHGDHDDCDDRADRDDRGDGDMGACVDRADCDDRDDGDKGECVR